MLLSPSTSPLHAHLAAHLQPDGGIWVKEGPFLASACQAYLVDHPAESKDLACLLARNGAWRALTRLIRKRAKEVDPLALWAAAMAGRRHRHRAWQIQEKTMIALLGEECAHTLLSPMDARDATDARSFVAFWAVYAPFWESAHLVRLIAGSAGALLGYDEELALAFLDAGETPEWDCELTGRPLLTMALERQLPRLFARLLRFYPRSSTLALPLGRWCMELPDSEKACQFLKILRAERPDSFSRSWGGQAARAAAGLGDLDALELVFTAPPAAPSLLDATGHGPLHYAGHARRQDVFAWLFSRGLDPEVRPASGVGAHDLLEGRIRLMPKVLTDWPRPRAHAISAPDSSQSSPN